MHRMIYLLTFAAPTALAAGEDGDLPDWALGVIALVAGVLIMVFSGARAASEARRANRMVGVNEEATAGAAQYLYIVMGGILAVFGLLITVGIITPA